MKTTRAFLLALAALVAGCGGGGGSGNSGNEDPGVVLPTTLAATGAFHNQFPSAALSGFRVFSSLAEYDGFTNLGPNKPVALRALDYNVNSVLYVEGPADDFLGATVRLLEIRRFDGTRETITGERCTNDIAGIPTPSRANRPYAFYVIPKLTSSVTFAGNSRVGAACQTVDVVSPLTRVAVGQVGPASGLPPPPFESRAIRSQAELDALKPSFPPGAIPQEYQAPNFATTTLLYVQARDNDANSFVRVAHVYRNLDGSHDVISEYCGNRGDFIPVQTAHALYAVPAFTGETHFVVIDRVPGACQTSALTLAE